MSNIILKAHDPDSVPILNNELNLKQNCWVPFMFLFVASSICHKFVIYPWV